MDEHPRRGLARGVHGASTHIQEGWPERARPSCAAARVPGRRRRSEEANCCWHAIRNHEMAVVDEQLDEVDRPEKCVTIWLRAIPRSSESALDRALPAASPIQTTAVLFSLPSSCESLATATPVRVVTADDKERRFEWQQQVRARERYAASSCARCQFRARTGHLAVEGAHRVDCEGGVMRGGGRGGREHDERGRT